MPERRERRVNRGGERRARGRGARAIPRVLILVGSASDLEVMEGTREVLRALGVSSEITVASAHRQPDRVRDLARNAGRRGVQVIVAGAGMAAHLAGAIAAHTILPVVGVPLAASTLGGLDSLLSTAQMPAGVPVATVAVGSAGARNAGYLAARILALQDRDLASRLRRLRTRQARGRRP